MGVFKKQGNWWIDFYHQGKRVRRKVGPSKKVAEMALADIQVKQSKKEFLGICETKKLLFKDFAPQYLEYSKANKARSSYDRDFSIIKLHVKPAWGDLDLSKITARTIEEYKVRRLEKVTAATFNREFNTIKNMFRKATEWGHLQANPTQAVKWIKIGQTGFRFLSHEEISLLLKACADIGNRQFFGIVLLAVNTGMRKGEILRLRWKEVDLKRRQVRVVSSEDGNTKNYKTRTIPMNRAVEEFLRKHPRRLDSPYVFQGPSGEPYTKTNYHFTKAVKRAGIPHARVHDLRHTFASHLVMKGIDLRTVQELLGHGDMRMTLKYAHLAPDHVRKAVEVLDCPLVQCDAEILDRHHLDTKAPERENQDAACQA
jgi:integrase